MKILEKIQKFLILSLPTFLILGIFDYRFNNYFWQQFNQIRPFQEAMFDFFSIFSLFTIVFSIFSFLMILTKRKIKLNPKIISISLFIAPLILALILSYFTHQPIEPIIKSLNAQLINNFILPILLFVSLLINFHHNKSLFQLFQKSILINFSLFAILILSQFFFQLFPGQHIDYLGRLVWPYIDPFFDLKAESANWLGFLFGPVSLLALLNYKQKWPILTLILSLTIILLSQSYTSIIILIALFFLYFFLQASSKTKIYIILTTFLLSSIILISQYNTPKFQILIDQYDHGKPNSIYRRSQIYQVSWHLIKQNPIHGLGAGNYQNLFHLKMLEVLPEAIPNDEVPPHPHNLLLHFYNEIGIFGFLWLLMTYALVSQQILYKKHLYFLTVAYTLGHGLRDTPFSLQENSSIIFIMLAICFYQYYTNTSKLNTESNKQTQINLR